MDNSTSNDLLNQDPDYSTAFSRDTNRQNIFENNARSNTAKKISSIIENEFLKEINNKKEEIMNIYKNLNKACKMLHYLRFAIVTDFYNQGNTLNNDNQGLKQTRPHPTVNFPNEKVSILDTNHANNCLKEIQEHNKLKRKSDNNNDFEEPQKKKLQLTDEEKNKVTMVAFNSKTKRRIIVGNLSKWIPPDFRDSDATHKWTVYIRDSQKYDLGQCVSKVRFFLHPSYKPNDVIELTSPPFVLCRHGWGEFPIRVQLHFVNNFDKPVDIIHHLKLDRTFTGLQTIGSETVVDLWITMKEKRPVTNFEGIKSTISNTVCLIDNKHENPNSLIKLKSENGNSMIKEKNENSNCLFKEKRQNSDGLTEEKSENSNCLFKEKRQNSDGLTEEKSKNSNCLFKEKRQNSDGLMEEKSENSHSSVTCQSLIDHDYLGIYSKFFKNTSGLQHSEVENGIVEVEGNKKNEKLMMSFCANPQVFHKTSPKQISLLKKSYTFGQWNASNNVKCIGYSSIKKSSSNIDSDNTKVYLKSNNSVNNVEDSKVLINLIEKEQLKSLSSLFKFITRKRPLITEKAVNLFYKVQYPYACESYEIFNNFSKGKRKALERYRALYVLDIINNIKTYKNSCNIKEFMIWARRYSYTPILNLKDTQETSELDESIDNNYVHKNYDYTSTISSELNKFLLECQKVKPSVENHENENDDEIDILNIPSNNSCVSLIHCNSNEKKNATIIMDYPEQQDNLQEFVGKTAQKIGIKFVNEEISEGVSHCTSSLLVTKAVRCLIEDLLRISLSCAIDRSKNQSDEILIKPNDICMALLKKDEFDIFINAGLGSEG